MGLCWSTLPPEDNEDGFKLSKLGKSTVGQNHFQGVYNLGGSFSKEEVRLRELLAALRTGLVFSPTEFSVLPGISTTGSVVFTLGSTELSPQVEEDEGEGESDDVKDEENLEATDEGEEEEEGEEKELQTKPRGPYELKLPLTGDSWTKDLLIKLDIWPAVGPFAGKKLMFLWSKNMLRVQGSRRGEISVRELPESFETERDFCKCCLLLTYQQHTANSLNFNDDEDKQVKDEESEGNSVLSLTTLAYRLAISNLDAVPDSLVLPAKVYHLFFGSQSPVSVTVRLWPETHANKFTANPTMHVKTGIIVSEFVYLLKEHFRIPSNYSLKLYHSHKRLQMGATLSLKHREIDCFVVASRSSDENALGGSNASLDIEEEEEGGEALESNDNLVVSLVGSGMQNVHVDLGMPLKDFDMLLRSKFNLREDSFLIIRSDDDFAPQYAADDNWKCTYPFSVPDNSLGAGLRRSFRRMSRKSGDNRLTQSVRARSQRSDASNLGRDGTFSPLMEKVVALLSSNGRQFPSNAGKYGFSVPELHNSMPMYNMSLDQCGIHPYSVVQAFEVTGPSIPVTFRVVSDYTLMDGGAAASTSQGSTIRTRLANIMDVNPSWSIDTFLQYVDAIISPASGVRRKRLCLKESYVEDSDEIDLSELTLGEVLDEWRPSWWLHTEETKRVQLSVKDIDPAEFLVVEKY